MLCCLGQAGASAVRWEMGAGSGAPPLSRAKRGQAAYLDPDHDASLAGCTAALSLYFPNSAVFAGWASRAKIHKQDQGTHGQGGVSEKI